MGSSKRVGQLRRLLDAYDDGELVFLTPRQLELARKPGYKFEQAPALESTLLAPRRFEPVVDVGAGAAADLEWWRSVVAGPMPRLTRPLTLSEAHLRWRREELVGALERGGQ